MLAWCDTANAKPFLIVRLFISIRGVLDVVLEDGDVVTWAVFGSACCMAEEEGRRLLLVLLVAAVRELRGW
jgi:hypothetical protein